MATHTIAVAGKGGVGKTTTCGMIIDYLCKKKDGPILVVDADANSNLNEVLGVEVETTLGDIREEMAQAELKGTMPKYMTKAEYADMKFSSALVEEDDFDMLVMGRTTAVPPTRSTDTRVPTTTTCRSIRSVSSSWPSWTSMDWTLDITIFSGVFSPR